MITVNAKSVNCDGVRGGLFVDRDGTLIRHIPYLHEPSKVELLPGVREALQRAQEAGLLLFLFTNQSGVGRGMFPIESALACNAEVVRQLSLPEIFAAECTAPEHPDDEPVYRKPSPRFIDEMRERFGLAREACWMVGDMPVDLQTAERAGIRGYRLTGERPLGVIVDEIIAQLA